MENLYDKIRRFNKPLESLVVNFGYFNNLRILRHTNQRPSNTRLKYYIRPFTIDWFISNEIFKQNIYKVHPIKGDKVLDVGAEIGLFSLLCASKESTVYAFEPLTENYNLLLKNINLNKFNNYISPFNFGLAKTNSTKPFYITRNSGNSSLIPYNTYNRKIYLPFKTIKEFLPCDILKMDIEGAEYEILLNTDLSQIKKELALEFHTHNNLNHFLNPLIHHISTTHIIDYFKQYQLNGYLHAKRKP